MVLIVVLASLLFGAATTLDLAGRGFVISWVDLAAYAAAGWALVVAGRRRVVVIDDALAAYAAVLVVVAVQVAVLPQPLEILGGSSRFVTAACVLFAATQAAHPRVPAGALDPGTAAVVPRDRPVWPAAIVGWGGVLGVWVSLRLAVALTDPDLSSFYRVKNAVVTPLGASNTLAGYLLVPTVAGLVLATRDRRLLVPAVLAGVGLVATLSRGALAAATVALVVGGVLVLRRRIVVAAAAAAAALAAVASLAAASRLPDVATSSPDGRLALWRAAVDALLDAPLLGVGLNRFATVTADLSQPHDHAHNLVLHTLAESGLLGGLAYLAIWAALARRLWRAEAARERTALALAGLALLLHAQVEALSYQRGIEVVLAVLLAAAATLPGSRAVREWRLGGGTTGGVAPRRR